MIFWWSRQESFPLRNVDWRRRSCRAQRKNRSKVVITLWSRFLESVVHCAKTVSAVCRIPFVNSKLMFFFAACCLRRGLHVLACLQGLTMWSNHCLRDGACLEVKRSCRKGNNGPLLSLNYFFFLPLMRRPFGCVTCTCSYSFSLFKVCSLSQEGGSRGFVGCAKCVAVVDHCHFTDAHVSVWCVVFIYIYIHCYTLPHRKLGRLGCS